MKKVLIFCNTLIILLIGSLGVTKPLKKQKKKISPYSCLLGIREVSLSTCHWCHVMERESFEDEEVAWILNDGFVAIKVDREERPDIDQIYMSVCQAMTGHGGWPLTVIMTPEKKPFFAGTYFPKNGRHGMPGLVDILTRIREIWESDRSKVVEVGERVAEALRSHVDTTPGGDLTKEILDKAFNQLRNRFDRMYGGFGTAPKFPTPHNLAFLLRYWKRTGEKEALDMVEKTLECMYNGGIYDHIGYGFSRYSTDEKWLVPHFEKMLYDNALLALAYIETYQATGRDFYAHAAKEIFTYVMRDMTSPEGGFYSAEDADSEGEEGKFYLWSPSEVKEVLGERDSEIFCRLYDITVEGNFEGRSIPNLIHKNMESEVPAELVKEMKKKLFAAREKRVHPFKDDKILTSWNGLMIAALAKGAAVFDNAAYRLAATQAVDFIYSKLMKEDGRLLARYREGEAAYLAYLDDYAFLAWGLLELYGATSDASYLKKADVLVKQAIDLFWDKENEGFFFYGEDAEQLIAKPKEVHDGALPSGNSVMLVNLLRLARLTGDESLDNIAEKLVKAFAGEVGAYPSGYTHFLIGVDFYTGPSREVVIAGRAGDPTVEKMLQAVRRKFLPETVTAFHPAGEAGRDIEKLAPFIREQRPINEEATAYICENYTCQAPVVDYNEFINTL